MAIPYTNNIPQATDLLSQSQADLLTNTSGVSTFLNINHVDFPSADAGKHKFLQLPEQGGAPATAANEAGFYSAVGVTSGVTELVFRRENNGTSIPFTESVTAANGWTRLPSGIILQWGTVNMPAGEGAVAYPFTIFTTATLSIQLTARPASGFTNIVEVINSPAPTVAGFQGKSTNTAGDGQACVAYFFAIGY